MGRKPGYIDMTTGELKIDRVASVYNYVARAFRNRDGRYERLDSPRDIPIGAIAHHAGLPWAFIGGDLAAENRPAVKLIGCALRRLHRLGLIEVYPGERLSVYVVLRVTPEALRSKCDASTLACALADMVKAVKR